MESTNYVVVTKKEEKILKNFNRACKILGLDLSKIAVLEKKVDELGKENDVLKEKIEFLRKENEDLINSKMNQIAVNIQNKTAKEGAVNQMKNFGFKGKTIDETF